MQQDTASDKKWVLYFYGSGVSSAVACEATPEELMPKAGIGQPVKWTDQGGRYIGIPFDGKLPAEFYYTINQDGETVYKVMTGQRPQPRSRQSKPKRGAFAEAFFAIGNLVGKALK